MRSKASWSITAETLNARTIDYAGLERATGVRKDDARSDIYFIGCIFYHMLSGQAALTETRDRIQRLSKSRFTNVVPIHQACPGIPRVVAAVLNKAMSLEPEKRHQTPGQMHAELQRGQHAFAANGNRRATGWRPIALPHALERHRLGVGHQPFPVHRDAVEWAQIAKGFRVRGARRGLCKTDRFKNGLRRRQQIGVRTDDGFERAGGHLLRAAAGGNQADNSIMDSGAIYVFGY